MTNLRILFLQDWPCIRNYKYAKALTARGHHVALAYTKMKLSERYPGMTDDAYAECIRLRDWRHLWDLTREYDIVHSHNEPDTLTVAALAGVAPVVHDTHDLISLRDAHKPDLTYYEGIANRGAQGRIYSTPYQMREAKRLYDIGEPNLVVYNFISRSDKPTRFLPKLSATDGEVHIVYEGGFGGPQHRRFQDIFTALAGQGAHVHIYPAAWKQQQADDLAAWPRVHYHQPVSPTQIMEEMTRYDFGIIPWNITEQNKRFLDSTIANKLFEYLAAGLPVFASPIESYVEYFTAKPVGLTFDTPEELVRRIPELRERVRNVDLTTYAESYEDHIEEVERFYAQLLDEGRAPRRRPATAEPAAPVARNQAAPPVRPDVLYVAFMDTRFAHIMRKMAQQAQGLGRTGLHVVVHVLGRAPGGALPEVPGTEFHVCEDEQSQLRTFAALLEELKPRLTYVRYQGKVMAGEGFAALARRWGNFVYESQTKKPVELRMQRSLDHLRREEQWGPELLRAARGLVGVTDEIVEYDRTRCGRPDLPALTLGNGIDVETVPLCGGARYTGELLSLVMAARFENWHGVDRVINALERESGVMLYLVGEGAIYESIRQYVQERGLADRVRLTGWLEGEAYDRLLERCHLALGSLAPHRIELREAAVLKVRDFLARGLPVVIGYRDVDIDADFPFALQVPASDAPLDLAALRAFALRVAAEPEAPARIREYARRRLDWQVKTAQLAAFLRGLMEPQAAPVPVTAPAPAPAIVAVQNSDIPRVLFVCHDFPPYRYAGAQLYALNLAKKLNGLGLARVDVIYPVFRDGRGADYTITQGVFEGVRVFELSKPKVKEPEKIWRDEIAEALRGFLKAHSYVAMHVHGLGQFTLAPLIVAREFRLPVVLTLHDYWFLCERWHMIRKDQRMCAGPESPEKCALCYLEDEKVPVTKETQAGSLRYHKWRQQMMRRAFALADKVFAPSRYLCGRFAEFGYEGVQPAPLGFEYGEIVTGHPSDGLFHFGYSGQVIARKGVNFLLEAFHRLPRKDVRLHVWGPVNAKYAEKLVADYTSDERIIFHGPYDPARLDEIYRSFHVAVVPSLMENYPLVVQEALLRRTPAIATTVGGIPEVLRDGVNGLLVPPESADALLAAMQRVLADPSLVERLTAGIGAVRRLEQDARHYAREYGIKDVNTANNDVISDNTHENGERKLRVQFYVWKNVHWPMFEELFRYVRTREEVGEVVLCLPNLPQLLPSDSFRPMFERILALPATIVTDPRAVPVDVTFVADTISGKVKGAGKIVNVGHGTISKGYYFTGGVWTERQNWDDLLCVPGAYALEAFRGALTTRVAATGMPKLDPVFAGRVDTAALRRQLNLDPNRKVVLYAPTFNADLSSLYDFLERFAELASNEYYVLIKLHGSTPGQMLAAYEQLAGRVPSFRYIADGDLAPWLALADVMISDVSSAWMEFMALDKPVILYDNPHAANYHGYDPANIEWAWRDLGTRVGSFDELKAVLPCVLREGDDKAPLRHTYAERLFADRAGNACAGVWRETLNVLRQPGTHQPPTISAVMTVHARTLYRARMLAHWLQFYSVMPTELVLLRPDDDPAVDGWVELLRNHGEFLRVAEVRGQDPTGALAAQAAQGEIMLWLDDDVQVFKNFDYLLYQTFRANPATPVLTGLCEDATRGGDLSRYLTREGEMSPARFAYELVYRYEVRQTATCACPRPALLALWRDRLPQGAQSAPLDWVRRQRELPVALSMYFNVEPQQNIAVAERFLAQYERIPAKDRYELGMQIFSASFYPDLALIALEAAVEGNRLEHLGQLVSSALFTRYYDMPLRARLEKTLRSFPGIVDYLAKDRAGIERLLAGQKKAPAPSVPAPEKPTSVKQAQRPPRVLFYFFKNVHIPILVPIWRKLRELRPDAEVAFAIMPLRPDIRAGFQPHEEKMIRDLGEYVVEDPQTFRPDVTFIADSIYGIVKGCGRIVHVGHGVLSKGQYYTDTPIARREQQADLVCVPGAWHAEALRRVITRPVLATGMAKLDAVFSGQLTRQNVLQHYGLPADLRYLLFAPTFNDELSALPLVAHRLPELLPDDSTLAVVKLHGSTAEHYRRLYADLVQRDPRVILVGDDEPDITPFLALADVLVSDVSSAMMEFAALDKPVALYDSPRWTDYANFHADDIDFTWRDIGPRARDFAELQSAVARCAAQPDEFAAQRRARTDALFANKYDGKAAERIIKAALSTPGQ